MQSLSLGNLAQRLGAVPPGTLPCPRPHTHLHITAKASLHMPTDQSRFQRLLWREYETPSRDQSEPDPEAHLPHLGRSTSESGPLQMRPIRDGRGSLLLLAPGFHLS